ncbi:MAG: hypothetical protein R3F11_29535 [Verrucomicrobiales bacterium]
MFNWRWHLPQNATDDLTFGLYLQDVTDEIDRIVHLGLVGLPVISAGEERGAGPSAGTTHEVWNGRLGGVHPNSATKTPAREPSTRYLREECLDRRNSTVPAGNSGSTQDGRYKPDLKAPSDTKTSPRPRSRQSGDR